MSACTPPDGSSLDPGPRRDGALLGRDRQPAREPLARLIEDLERFRRYVQRWVADPDDAREVVHDLCVKLLEGADGPRRGTPADAWLRRALHNRAIDRYRRAAVRRRMLADFAQELASASAVDDQPAGRCACPLDRLASLPTRERDVIRRADLLGEPRSQLAADLGITPSHLAVRLHRARRALRRLVAVHCGAGCADGRGTCECAPGGEGASASRRSTPPALPRREAPHPAREL